MNVHPTVYSVSTTRQGLSMEELVTEGARHSGCLERELAKRLALAVDELGSAIERLREIAALKGASKRQKVNSELAISWLLARGYPLEEDGYVPGKGFKQETENV